MCNPGAGNEKGRVERAIRTLRETFFNTMEKYSSLKALNHALHEWVDHKNQTVHRATEKKPAELLQEEKLRPLPEKPWNNVLIHPPVKTTKTAMMIFDTNSYSVPDYLVGKSLSIHSTPNTVMIYEATSKWPLIRDPLTDAVRLSTPFTGVTANSPERQRSSGYTW